MTSLWRRDTLTDIGRMEAEAEKKKQEAEESETEREPRGQLKLDRYA